MLMEEVALGAQTASKTNVKQIKTTVNNRVFILILSLKKIKLDKQVVPGIQPLPGSTKNPWLFGYQTTDDMKYRFQKLFSYSKNDL